LLAAVDGWHPSNVEPYTPPMRISRTLEHAQVAAFGRYDAHLYGVLELAGRESQPRDGSRSAKPESEQ